jgi:dipeptidyl aminopeptidase/acylaminoacyl peptidase
MKRLLGVFLCGVMSAPVVADSSLETSLSRALSVTPDQLEKLVRGEQLTPQWRARSSQFWFAADRVGGVEYLRVDPAKKSIEPLFDRARLAAAFEAATGQASPGEFDDAGFDFDTKAFSFELRGERWTYSTTTHELSKGVSNVALSPDKRWRVLVRDYNLYLQQTASGQVRQLTTDGSAQTPYALPIPSLKDMAAQGTSTPVLDVYVEWSPDSQRFATYQMNLAGARHLSAVQSTPPDGGPPRIFDYIYPFTGDEHLATAHTVIVTAATGAVTRVESPVKEMLYWWGAPEFHWTRDSGAILQRIADRGYQAVRLYSTDAATGRSTQLYADESDLFVDFYGHRWTYSLEANAAFWLSDDRAGWKQVLRVSPRGEKTALTSGKWTAVDIAGNDASGKAVFVVGRGREQGRDPYLRHLYRIENDGRKMTLLTSEAADHDTYVSPDGRFFVDNISTIEQPTRSVLRSTRDGAVVMELQRADISELTQRGLRLPEPFTTLAADGRTPLYGATYKPSSFDPGKRYPVVEYIYSGPHAITAPKSFKDALRVDAAFSMAELGFVVVVVDGRGTSGRGRAFLDPAYKNLHAVGLDDHIAAIQSLAAKRSYMDASAVGIYGFSAGGYDVVRAMTERPDFYKVGVSASGNHDNRLDKAIWNEQWMGYPLGQHYMDNSNVTWAPKLAGKLLLAHGELDENVPPAATLRLVDALIVANKPFELLIVPNGSHWLAPLPHYNRRRFEFFLRELAKPGTAAGASSSQLSP